MPSVQKAGPGVNRRLDQMTSEGSFPHISVIIMIETNN